MDNLINNYLKTEQQHLEVLTKLLPNSLLALSDISVTTNEIVKKLNNTSNNLKLLSNEYEQKTLNLIKDKHLAFKEENDKFNLTKEKEQKLLSDNIRELHTAFRTKQRLNREKTISLQQEKKDSSKQIQNYFAEHRLVVNKENSKLEALLEEKRKIYFEKIDNIYQQKIKDINQINEHYTNLLTDYHRVNKKRLRQQAERVNTQQENKDNSLNFQKNDLIDARQNYYNTLNILNEKINSIQANYKKLLDENNLFATDKKSRTNEQLKNFSNLIYENNQTILDDFEASLKEIDSITDKLKQQHSLNETTLINKHNRLITSINVKLYQEKEKLNKQLENINPLAKSEIKEINKKIKKLESETKNKHKKAAKAHFKELKALTKTFIEKVTLQRHQILIRDTEKRNYLLLNKKLLSQHENFSFKQNQLYTEQKELLDEIINKSQSLEIVPIDIQTTLANHIYTTESQFYHQDQSDIQEDFTRQIDIIEKRSLSREIILLRSKERIEINNDSEIKQSELNHYFNMEFEKNRRNYEESLLNQKMKINKANYHIQALKGKHKQELFMEKLFHELEKLNTLINIEKEKVNLETALLREQNLIKVITEQHKLEKANTTKSIKNNIESCNLTLKYYQDILKEQKELTSLLYNQLKKIVLSININNKQHLTPELLEHQQGLFKNTTGLLNETIESTTNSLLNFFQLQLNNLTEKKHKNAFETLLNEYNQTIFNINRKISSITDQLNNYMINQANVLNKIQSLNMDNKAILKTITHLNNKLQVAKRKNANSTATKLIEQDIIVKQKSHVKNKENIKLYELQIKQINKRISIFEKQISSLNNEKDFAEKDKNYKERKLNTYLHNEGKFYYKAIQKINSNKNNLINFNKAISLSFNNLLNYQLKDTNSFKKQSTKYNKELVKLQLNINNYFNYLHSTINGNYAFIVSNEEKELEKINQTFTTSINKFNKEHKQDLKKINLNLNSLFKYLDNTVKLSGLRLDKAIKVLEDKQAQELLRLVGRKDNQETKLTELDSSYSLFIKAFNLNKQQALNIENNYLKDRLKQAEKQSNTQYQKTQTEIKIAEDEIAAFKKRRQLQLNYISSVDKDNRKKLANKQNSLNSHFQNELKLLTRQKPKINNKIRANRLKSQTRKNIIKKAYENKQKIYQRRKNFILPFLIKKQQAKAIRAIKKA